MRGWVIPVNHFAPIAIDMWILTGASGALIATLVAFDPKGFSINIP